MRITTAGLYKAAYGRYAIGHFNVTNMEQVLGMFSGAGSAGAPFIIALSRAAWAYAGLDMLEMMIAGAEAQFPDAVFAVHHDHGTESTCLQAIESGYYTSVMIDASHEPFEKNIATTRRVVDAAHRAGISVEAELGIIAGAEDDISIRQEEARLTRPENAAEFVARTGVDSLAVAVGTSHGAYKFSGDSGIRFDRLAEIQAALPGFPLVLHGASAVYPKEVERINKAGGRIAGAKGVDDSQLTKAVKLGITKVNVGTDGRLVWTRVHREFFRNQPEQFDFAQPGKAYIEAYADLVAHKCRVLGSAGRLSEFRTIEPDNAPVEFVSPKP